MIRLRPNTLLRHTFRHGGPCASVVLSPASTTPCRDRSSFLLPCDMDENGKSDKRQRVHCTVPHGTARPQPASRPTTVSGLVYLDHNLQVPLDHANPDGETINIFAREVIAIEKYPNAAMPLLCFFQGGPGFQSPAPSDSLCWLNSATKTFRVVLLDQRGTGKSTPIRLSTLTAVGDEEAQAKYCSFFRADSIVKDAELLRKHLNPDNTSKPWSILGQSFGGFCCVEYLSKFPDGVAEALITGGLPPAIDEHCAADIVYNATYQRVYNQNRKFYQRFPEDIAKVKAIVRLLNDAPGGAVQTPGGNYLRPRSLQMLGMSICVALGAGGPGGGFDRLHFMLDSAIDMCGPTPELTPQFLKTFDACVPFDTNPLYALLHEACYSCGGATKWAAQRVQDDEWAKLFDPVAAAYGNDSDLVMFTGEMVFPWMFEDLAGLRPMKGVAEVLANRTGWSKLYDSKQLQYNEVPVVAATYVEDMYVDFNLAQETASKIKGIRQWMTNEFQHSGIRDDGQAVFDRLMSMVRNVTVIF